MKLTILINDSEIATLDVDLDEKTGERCQMSTITSGVKTCVNSVDFSLYFNQKMKDKGIVANKTKMQKLLYICYGTYLKVFDMAQLFDEKPMAWDYGPAFSSVYSAQKSNDDGLDGLLPLCQEKLKELMQFDTLIDSVLDFFGDWTSWELVEWTHEKGTAWDKKYSKERYAALSNEDIFEDFSRYVM